MKRNAIALFTVVLFTITAYAQQLPINKATGKVTYMEVVTAEDVSSGELMKIFKDWGVAQKFTEESAAGVPLQYKGKFIVNHPSIKGNNMASGKVEFVVQLFAKEGRFKHVITDFVHSSEGANGGKLESQTAECGANRMTGRAWVVIKQKTHQLAKKLVADLKRVVQEYQNDPARDDNW